MTLDREFHTKRIVPAQPKSFRTIIEETRQRIIEDLDLQAQEAIETASERTNAARQFNGGE